MEGRDICNDFCTGCAACSAICTVGAIRLTEDDRGFRKPVVNTSICIECKKCQRVCNNIIQLQYCNVAFIAKHRDREVYKLSQSGGAFTAISDYVLDKGGVIYGAKLDNRNELIHFRASSVSERNQMRGSKYIQSILDQIYKSVEKDLAENRYVLFTGTACQVGGLKKYIKLQNLNDKKLYTIDIFCHGVPSILLWRDMKEMIEKKYKRNISSIEIKELRDNSRPMLCFNTSEHMITDKLFRKLYYSNLALRESCYHCQYTKLNRVGDISIGDAQGSINNDPDFYEKRGISLVLLNSTKGEELENYIKERMQTKDINIEKYKQECLRKPSSPKRSVEEFWNDYKKMPFTHVIDKYAKHKVLLNLPYIIKKGIGKIRGI